MSLIEDAVRLKALELLDYCEQNFKGLREPEGKVDSDGNIPGYRMIAKCGDVTDFGEDTLFYKIFRRILFQGRFSSEEMLRMKDITDPERGEGYCIDDIIAFALGATHKKSICGPGLSLQKYFYEKEQSYILLGEMPEIDYSDL